MSMLDVGKERLMIDEDTAVSRVDLKMSTFPATGIGGNGIIQLYRINLAYRRGVGDLSDMM